MCASAEAIATSTSATAIWRIRRDLFVIAPENRGGNWGQTLISLTESPLAILPKLGSDPNFLKAWHPRDGVVPNHLALLRLERVDDVHLRARVFDAHADALRHDGDHRAADPVALGDAHLHLAAHALAILCHGGLGLLLELRACQHHRGGGADRR